MEGIFDEFTEEPEVTTVQNPGDFSNAEDEKSFNVYPSEGLTLTMQSSAGGGSQAPAALVLQGNLSPSGLNVVYILSDQKSPSMQAVLMNSQKDGKEAKMLRLTSSFSPAGGLDIDQEVAMMYTGIESMKTTFKWKKDDFYTTLAVSPMGDGPKTAEFSYHQAIDKNFTAGGTLNAMLGDKLVPYPSVQGLTWSLFGSFTNTRKDFATFVNYGLQSNPFQGLNEVFKVQTWKRISKTLEAGANFSATTSNWTNLERTETGAGFRMTFQSPSGLNPTLTAHFSSDLVASMQLQKPFASIGSNTFMRTTLNGRFDHKQKSYTWGAQIELYS